MSSRGLQQPSADPSKLWILYWFKFPILKVSSFTCCGILRRRSTYSDELDKPATSILSTVLQVLQRFHDGPDALVTTGTTHFEFFAGSLHKRRRLKYRLIATNFFFVTNLNGHSLTRQRRLRALRAFRA